MDRHGAWLGYQDLVEAVCHDTALDLRLELVRVLNRTVLGLDRHVNDLRLVLVLDRGVCRLVVLSCIDHISL